MLENRLYIVEATVPQRAPEPGLFQQSPRFLDADGKPVRYPDNYVNMYGIPEASPAQREHKPRPGDGEQRRDGQHKPRSSGQRQRVSTPPPAAR